MKSTRKNAKDVVKIGKLKPSFVSYKKGYFALELVPTKQIQRDLVKLVKAGEIPCSVGYRITKGSMVNKNTHQILEIGITFGKVESLGKNINSEGRQSGKRGG